MATLITVVAIIAVASLGFVWFTRRIWFFRDPEHSKTPQDPSQLLSPVYGRVAYIERIRAGEVVSDKKGEEIHIKDITKHDWPSAEDDGWLIGIAMTALDVHYQYAPISARVGRTEHFQHGRNLPMFDVWEYIKITWFRRAVQLFAKRYVFDNERQTMWLEGEHARIALVLIADKFVSKIKTFVKPGDTVPAGGKLSFIGRGSQVDVVVCGQPNMDCLVAVGQAVHGPATTLARFDPQDQARKVVQSAQPGNDLGRETLISS